MFGLLIGLGLALFVAPFACSWPDGLDRTAQLLGFENKAREEALVSAPAADYKVPGIGSEALATSLAGAAGTIVAFVLAWVLARVLVPNTDPPKAAEAGSSQ